MEKIFSKIDLAEIEREAFLNLELYLDTFVASSSTFPKTILTISKNRQLVIVEGNTDTGFGHLVERHGFFSIKPYWKISENGSPQLDTPPSKFHHQLMPIVDFVKIADSIFQDENKNTTKNKRPDIFDMYSGFYSNKNLQPEKFHLLVYKDTKVVHTLFPDTKKNNPKIKFKFARGLVSAKTTYPAGFNDLIIPYENSEGITVFSILVRKSIMEKIECCYLQRHDEKGVPVEFYKVHSRSITDVNPFSRETMVAYQFGDLSQFEKLIMQIGN